MVDSALRAAAVLKEKGIDAGVINMSTIKPLDTEMLLKLSQACRLIVTAEEHSIIGGLGSAVSEFLSENHPSKVLRIGIKDNFGCSGKSGELLKLYGLTAENIVKTVTEGLK
jgi:transketolase